MTSTKADREAGGQKTMGNSLGNNHLQTKLGFADGEKNCFRICGNLLYAVVGDVAAQWCCLRGRRSCGAVPCFPQSENSVW